MLQQMLGDFSHSITTNNLVIQAMKTAFAGTRHAVHAEAALMSVYGWSALVFDGNDLRGTYVLCDPQLLLAAGPITEASEEEKEDDLLSKVSPTKLGQQVVSLTQPLGRLFKWGKGNSQPPAYNAGNEEVVVEDEVKQQAAAIITSKEKPESQEVTSGGMFGRFRQRVTGLLRLTQV